ncbi:MAG: hypothetical protein GC168_05150 [Candidatus Hydrogenedens sp.]|nr:hypothetical protein [Candidatus Hydrogenedens sp.]
MRQLLWVVSMLGAILGACLVILIPLAANGAPQEAAAAGLALAFAVIPYCFARAASEIVTIAKEAKRDKAIEDLRAIVEQIAQERG